MTNEQIKYMVDRFLCWRLPESFLPDAGISFRPEFNVEYMARQGKPPMRHEPVGTNLFSASEAEAMVRHMLEGLPGPNNEAEREHNGGSRAEAIEIGGTSAATATYSINWGADPIDLSSRDLANGGTLDISAIAQPAPDSMPDKPARKWRITREDDWVVIWKGAEQVTSTTALGKLFARRPAVAETYSYQISVIPSDNALFVAHMRNQAADRKLRSAANAFAAAVIQSLEQEVPAP